MARHWGLSGVKSPTPTSQNGWPAHSDRRRIAVETFVRHGVSFPGGVKAGDVATIAAYVVDRFHNEVEKLVPGWCWGWAWRAVRGGASTSNHASGTAWDVNAPRHPLGKSGTFTPQQIARIREIVRACGGTVRWGGDYSGRKDEMHFEINAGAARVAAVANTIRAAQRPVPEEDSDMLILAQKKDSKEIWVGDGIHRRHLEDMTEVTGLQSWMQRNGHDPDIKEGWADLRVLGVDVTERPE